MAERSPPDLQLYQDLYTTWKVILKASWVALSLHLHLPWIYTVLTFSLKQASSSPTKGGWAKSYNSSQVFSQRGIDNVSLSIETWK